MKRPIAFLGVTEIETVAMNAQPIDFMEICP